MPPRDAPKGQKASQAWYDAFNKKMNIHEFLTDHTDSMLSKVAPQHQEGVKRLFDKVAFESPSYKPTGALKLITISNTFSQLKTHTSVKRLKRHY